MVVSNTIWISAIDTFTNGKGKRSAYKGKIIYCKGNSISSYCKGNGIVDMPFQNKTDGMILIVEIKVYITQYMVNIVRTNNMVTSCQKK